MQRLDIIIIGGRPLVALLVIGNGAIHCVSVQIVADLVEIDPARRLEQFVHLSCGICGEHTRTETKNLISRDRIVLSPQQTRCARCVHRLLRRHCSETYALRQVLQKVQARPARNGFVVVRVLCIEFRPAFPIGYGLPQLLDAEIGLHQSLPDRLPVHFSRAFAACLVSVFGDGVVESLLVLVPVLLFPFHLRRSALLGLRGDLPLLQHVLQGRCKARVFQIGVRVYGAGPSLVPDARLPQSLGDEPRVGVLLGGDASVAQLLLHYRLVQRVELVGLLLEAQVVVHGVAAAELLSIAIAQRGVDRRVLRGTEALVFVIGPLVLVSPRLVYAAVSLLLDLIDEIRFVFRRSAALRLSADSLRRLLLGLRFGLDHGFGGPNRRVNAEITSAVVVPENSRKLPCFVLRGGEVLLGGGECLGVALRRLEQLLEILLHQISPLALSAEAGLTRPEVIRRPHSHRSSGLVLDTLHGGVCRHNIGGSPLRVDILR